MQRQTNTSSIRILETIYHHNSNTAAHNTSRFQIRHLKTSISAAFQAGISTGDFNLLNETLHKIDWAVENKRLTKEKALSLIANNSDIDLNKALIKSVAQLAWAGAYTTLKHIFHTIEKILSLPGNPRMIHDNFMYELLSANEYRNSNRGNRFYVYCYRNDQRPETMTSDARYTNTFLVNQRKHYGVLSSGGRLTFSENTPSSSQQDNPSVSHSTATITNDFLVRQETLPAFSATLPAASPLSFDAISTQPQQENQSIPTSITDIIDITTSPVRASTPNHETLSSETISQAEIEAAILFLTNLYLLTGANNVFSVYNSISEQAPVTNFVPAYWALDPSLYMQQTFLPSNNNINATYGINSAVSFYQASSPALFSLPVAAQPALQPAVSEVMNNNVFIQPGRYQN